MLKDKLKGALPVPKLIGAVIGVLVLVVVANKSIFYAEPGYVYHVRTITGQEQVVSDVGYQFFFFGRWNSWKRALTVQAVKGGSENLDYVEVESSETSAALPPQNIMFLDQVDANAQATVRFTIPSDKESFLQLAHEYRNPENLLRTALIPAFKETLQANASLMSAEEYYSGGRTEFNTEFENQMINGIYIVRREEISEKRVGDVRGSANVAMGTQQQDYGDDSKSGLRGAQDAGRYRHPAPQVPAVYRLRCVRGGSPYHPDGSEPTLRRAYATEAESLCGSGHCPRTTGAGRRAATAGHCPG